MSLRYSLGGVRGCEYSSPSKNFPENWTLVHPGSSVGPRRIVEAARQALAPLAQALNLLCASTRKARTKSLQRSGQCAAMHDLADVKGTPQSWQRRRLGVSYGLRRYDVEFRPIARKSRRHSDSKSLRANFSTSATLPRPDGPLCIAAAISRIVRWPSTCWTKGN